LRVKDSGRGVDKQSNVPIMPIPSERELTFGRAGRHSLSAVLL